MVLVEMRQDNPMEKIISTQIAPKVGLNRLIDHTEKVELSKVLFTMIEKQTSFPIEPGDSQLDTMLCQHGIEFDIINWLTSFQHDSIQEIAMLIRDHNQTFIMRLTA